MRYRLAAILVLLLCVLASCSGTPAPERDLDKMLGYLSSGKITKAEKYIFEDTLHIDTRNKSEKKFYTAMFSSITYVVSGSVVQENSAEANVSVTMIDIEALMFDASLAMLENNFSGTGTDKYYKLMLDKISAGEAAYDSDSVTVRMVREDGRWKCVMAESGSFADAITGGVGELIGY